MQNHLFRVSVPSPSVAWLKNFHWFKEVCSRYNMAKQLHNLMVNLRATDVKLMRQLLLINESIESIKWMIEEKAIASRGSSLSGSLCSLLESQETSLHGSCNSLQDCSDGLDGISVGSYLDTLVDDVPGHQTPSDMDKFSDSSVTEDSQSPHKHSKIDSDEYYCFEKETKQNKISKKATKEKKKNKKGTKETRKQRKPWKSYVENSIPKTVWKQSVSKFTNPAKPCGEETSSRQVPGILSGSFWPSALGCNLAYSWEQGDFELYFRKQRCSFVDDETILYKASIPYCSEAMEHLQFFSVDYSPQGHDLIEEWFQTLKSSADNISCQIHNDLQKSSDIQEGRNKSSLYRTVRINGEGTEVEFNSETEYFWTATDLKVPSAIECTDTGTSVEDAHIKIIIGSVQEQQELLKEECFHRDEHTDLPSLKKYKKNNILLEELHLQRPLSKTSGAPDPETGKLNDERLPLPSLTYTQFHNQRKFLRNALHLVLDNHNRGICCMSEVEEKILLPLQQEGKRPLALFRLFWSTHRLSFNYEACMKKQKTLILNQIRFEGRLFHEKRMTSKNLVKPQQKDSEAPPLKYFKQLISTEQLAASSNWPFRLTANMATRQILTKPSLTSNIGTYW
ncbi:hypothetical protein IHE44_0011407 [Lamprotornis superbus]|uniref:Uncharacterized protein n=1 Tax=Lamprotornis superbus TaxID=245042 RepID=A0A835NJC4_9PASS|nr:hypothetical protein IHE44_0011407 [Lamprotornis superbus]